MRALLIVFLLITPSLPALAGPWPREARGWFVATTLGQERTGAGRQLFGELYAEYGAAPQLTLAMHLQHSPGSQRGDLLARWHPRTERLSLPFGLSLGARLNPGCGDRYLLLAAAHLGHGFDLRQGNAWARLDLQMQARPTEITRPVELSLSGQLGLRTAQGLLGMVSLTHTRRNRGSVLELSPAIGQEIGRNQTLVLSLTARPVSRRVTSAQLSVWSRF